MKTAAERTAYGSHYPDWTIHLHLPDWLAHVPDHFHEAAPQPSPVPAIIDLDEASLRKYGQ
ncbi:MAG: hypothetical protein LBB66_10370 [Desulfovibrio sp.]|nr:hypothetical protein [Desulfovibrio sp.]